MTRAHLGVTLGAVLAFTVSLTAAAAPELLPAALGVPLAALAWGRLTRWGR